MDEKQLARLPKWAQEHIHRQDLKIKTLTNIVNRFEATNRAVMFPNRIFFGTDVMGDLQWIPPHDTVTFIMGEGRNHITVRHDDGGGLRVNSSNKGLIIRPGAFNACSLFTGD